MNLSRVAVGRRHFKRFSLQLLPVILTLGVVSCRQRPADPVGTWRCLVKNPSGEDVAFTLEVGRQGSGLVGSLVNGDERTTSTRGLLDGRTFKLQFDFYDADLTATIDGDRLSGTFTRQWQKQILKKELRGSRVGEGPKLSTINPGADLSGEWVVRVGQAPKESLWRAAFHQRGVEVRGTIIPVSGDWGQLTGSFENGRLTLNRFDGINSRVFKARLTPEGKLEGIIDLGLFDPTRKILAERLDEKNKDSVAGLPNPYSYTRMSNPVEPFRFGFPGLDGNLVSSTDERFKDKVVVISITGTWCPNCHEEGPLMQQFYQRYHAQGLEIVALAFEYTGQVERDLEQVKIFAKRYGITYPMLLAGSTEEGDLQRKLPQLVSFGGYPTSIFIGRDGLVKRIHTGFEGKATGERHERLKAEFDSLIRELLGE